MPKFKCPHCGRICQIIAIKSASRHVTLPSVGALIGRARGADPGEPEAQEEARRAFSTRTETTRQPVASANLESQWKTPLAIASTTAVAVFAVAVPMLYVLQSKWPLLLAYLVGMCTFFIVWSRKVGFFSEAMFAVKNVAEEILDRDPDGDGSVGEPPPPEIRFVPVRQAGQPATGFTLPEPVSRPERRVWLNERRSIRVSVLVNMLTEAQETDNWTRDYWQSRGVGQKEWADIKDFCERFGIWRADDPSLLHEFVTRFLRDGNEPTNGNERNGKV